MTQNHYQFKPLNIGRWIVWGNDDLSASHTFESLDAAKRAVAATSDSSTH